MVKLTIICIYSQVDQYYQGCYGNIKQKMGDVSSAHYRSERPVTKYPRPRFVPRPRFDGGYNARALEYPAPHEIKTI